MPEKVTDLTGLIARVREATGPDRELDLLVHALVAQAGEWSEGDIAYALTDVDGTTAPPSYTESTDAAIALAHMVVATNGRKLICFFCAGGQLTPFNADEGSPDYHPLALIDNSVTAGWMAHVAFYNADGGTSGPDRYFHGANTALAIVGATLMAIQSEKNDAQK